MTGNDIYAPLTGDHFKLFRDYIHEQSGIFLDDYKSEALRTALITLMRQRDIFDYDEYYLVLTGKSKGEEEFKRLLDLVTVNETCFFRNPGQFEALRQIVLPDILRVKEETGDRTLRVWSAGCSTGEEPYSLAMTLLETLPHPDDWRIDILATDVSARVLSEAQKGCYKKRTLRETPVYYLRKYFKKVGDETYCIDSRVREMVNFSYHNLVTERYPALVLGGWDMIFCRNVTIYFQMDSVRKVMNNFYTALRDGGYLFIGHAESLYKINDEFIPMRLGNAYVYKKDKDALVNYRGEAKASLCYVDCFGGVPAKQVRPQASGRAAERARFRRDEDKAGLYATAYEHFIKEEFDQAAQEAAKLVKVGPENVEAHILLANVFVNQGRIERAANEVTKVLELQPMSPKGHYLLGLIREKQSQPDEAVREFKRVLYIDRTFALAHINLANIYRTRHMAADAAREYNSAIAGLAQSPRGDWADFAGGFLEEVLIEICKRNLAQLA